MKKIKINRILKKEDGTYSILDTTGTWHNKLKSNYGFKEGEEVIIHNNQLFSLEEAETIRKYKRFKEKLKEKVKYIKEDYEEALEIFRSVFGREPQGQEFAVLNNIVLMLQKERYFIKRNLEFEDFE